jgi:formate dehydrogenase major subunit
MHTGMSYERLDALGGLQWPCPEDDHPGSPFLHGRLWTDDVGTPAPFVPVEWLPPVDELSEDYPIRLTTGRRMDSYNTGVQSGRYSSPRRIHGGVDLAPEDAHALEVTSNDTVRVTSRRGSIDAPVRLDRGLRPGLAFMSIHFPDDAREPPNSRRLPSASRRSNSGPPTARRSADGGRTDGRGRRAR